MNRIWLFSDPSVFIQVTHSDHSRWPYIGPLGGDTDDAVIVIIPLQSLAAYTIVYAETFINCTCLPPLPLISKAICDIQFPECRDSS